MQSSYVASASLLLAVLIFASNGIAQDGQIYPPFDYTIFRGFVIDSELGDFIESDDIRTRFNPGFTIHTELPVWLIFHGVVAEPVDLLVESSSNTPGLIRFVEAWNYSTNWYDDLEFHNESYAIDSVLIYELLETEHIAIDGSVRARIGWRKTGFTLVNPWEIRVDQVGWVGTE